jgi:hypothetical protein
MARRTFENKSRLQNTEEIIRRTDNFVGQVSDIPANDAPNGSLREMLDCLAVGWGVVPRKGFYAQYVLPGVVSSGVSGSMDTNKLVTVSAGHTFTSADIGKLLCWSDGTIGTIATTPTGATCTLTINSSVAKSADTQIIIRSKVNSYIFHPSLQEYILHVGTTVYRMSEAAGTLTQVYLVGPTAISDVTSTMSIVGEDVVICAQALWRVNKTENRYWKVNHATNGNPLEVRTGKYTRRYLYTMTRQRITKTTAIGANDKELFYNRGTLSTGVAQQLIATETGACQRFALCGQSKVIADYIDVGANLNFGDSSIAYADAPELYYDRLTCGAITDTTTVMLNGCFNVTMDSTTYMISYSLSSGTALDRLASVLNSKVLTWFPTAKVYVTGSALVFENYAAGGSVGYLSTPATIPTGYIDVSAALKGTSGTGTITHVNYYTPAVVSNLVPWSTTDWKAFTHYSVYCSENVNEETTLGADPNAFAWTADVPLMRCMIVTRTSTALAVKSGKPGRFLSSDLGAYVTAISTSLVTTAKIWNITSVVANEPVAGAVGSAVVTGTGADGDYYLFFGAVRGILGTISGSTLTVTNWLTTNAEFPTVSYTCTWGSPTELAVGDPLFLQDGSVAVVTAKTDANTYTVASSYSGSFASYSAAGPIAIVPQGVVAASSSTTPYWPYRFFDKNSDSVINARVGTLGLLTRFWDAMPNPTIGHTVPGWFIANEQATAGKYNYVNLPDSRNYLLGSYNAGHHSDKIGVPITHFDSVGQFIAVFSASTTRIIQLGLNISFTDVSNGSVIEALPTSDVVDDNLGAAGPSYVTTVNDSSLAVINQDGGIRIFDGFKYGNNLVYNKIMDKISALASASICYDDYYGLVVFGTLDVLGYRYDKTYSVGIDSEGFLGCATLTLPSLEYPVKIRTSTGQMCYPSAGTLKTTAGTLTVKAGYLTRGYRTEAAASYQDGNATNGHTAAYYTGSITTQDDIGDTQLYRIRHQEKNIYMTGLLTETGNTSVLNVTAYNDIGTQVAQALTCKGSPYFDASIHFATVLEGHRIRFKYDWDKALYIVNGYMDYYSVYDRATSLTNRRSTENDVEASEQDVIFGFGKSLKYLNLATGLPLTVTGTLSRVTGSDSKAGTGIDFSAGGLLGGSLSAASGTAFTISFWLKTITGTNTILSSSDIVVSIAAGAITITGLGIAGSVSATLLATVSWTEIYIVKNGAAISVYQDNVSKYSNAAICTAGATLSGAFSDIGKNTSGAYSNIAYLKIFNGAVIPT